MRPNPLPGWFTAVCWLFACFLQVPTSLEHAYPSL